MDGSDPVKVWLDKRGLGEWVMACRPDFSVAGDAVARAIRRWKAGEGKEPFVHYTDAADSHLTALDLHEWEIPDRLWVSGPESKVSMSGPKKSAKRIEAEELILAGHNNLEIRKHFADRGESLDRSQLCTWRNKLDRADRVVVSG